jgi:hypothetical protein
MHEPVHGPGLYAILHHPLSFLTPRSRPFFGSSEAHEMALLVWIGCFLDGRGSFAQVKAISQRAGVLGWVGILSMT